MPLGLEIYLLPLPTFIPSVIVFLCMVQLFQKRELSCEQHNSMHWAEQLQNMKTIGSHDPSVCMILYDLFEFTLSNLSNSCWICHSLQCQIIYLKILLPAKSFLCVWFSSFLSQTGCNILQPKENNCFAFLSDFAFHVARTFWEPILFFITFVPHTCSVYFAPLINMYNIPSLVKILHNHISSCT